MIKANNDAGATVSSEVRNYSKVILCLNSLASQPVRTATVAEPISCFCSYNWIQCRHLFSNLDHWDKSLLAMPNSHLELASFPYEEVLTSGEHLITILISRSADNHWQHKYIPALLSRWGKPRRMYSQYTEISWHFPWSHGHKCARGTYVTCVHSLQWLKYRLYVLYHVNRQRMPTLKNLFGFSPCGVEIPASGRYWECEQTFCWRLFFVRAEKRRCGDHQPTHSLCIVFRFCNLILPIYYWTTEQKVLCCCCWLSTVITQ